MQQCNDDYARLLEQFSCLKAEAASSNSQHFRQDISDLETANAALNRQLQQSQQQLQQHKQEADKAQQLLQQLSKAAADIHAASEKAEAPSSAAERGSSARHNLQAVHDAVQTRVARYDSQHMESEQSDDDSSEVLLPALWKPQKERHLAPTGFR